MAWVEVLDNDVYYVEAGEGQPLVFLRGMSSCGEACGRERNPKTLEETVMLAETISRRSVARNGLSGWQ